MDPNAILFCGTSAQLHGDNSRLHERLLAPILSGHAIAAPDVRWCSEAGRFWRKFFGTGEKGFLDADSLILPAVLVATGQMRDHNYLGGETIEPGKRLKEIADNFGVPIEFVSIPYF